MRRSNITGKKYEIFGHRKLFLIEKGMLMKLMYLDRRFEPVFRTNISKIKSISHRWVEGNPKLIVNNGVKIKVDALSQARRHKRQ